MTLTETANFLDRQQRDADSDQNVSALGQVMVAISSQGPDPGRLLRKTARLAAQLNAQWYAVYVRTPAESAVRIDAETQRRVNDTLETAQKMGGLVFSMKGESVAQALVAFAREYGITHIVVGRPGRRRWRQYFQPILHEVLLQELPDVDLVVV
jgi:two-component system sensor histidine kinase KdpD